MEGMNIRPHLVLPVPATALLLMALLTSAPAAADVHLIDDSGQTLTLPAPARRIVSLAPYTTEMLFAVGAGDRIVGATRYADVPEAARKIPRIGDSNQLDLERIVSLKPDVLVVWRNGSSEALLDKLRSLRIPIFYSQPGRLAAIPAALIRFGQLAGTEALAARAAAAFETRLEDLGSRYANRPKVSVFYQLWHQPLLTINGEQQISDVISLCGGVNIFAGRKPLVAPVTAEAVVSANPEAIVTVNEGPESEAGLDIWKKIPGLLATIRGNYILLNSDIVSLQSPRILDGATALCINLEKVRAKRKP